MFIHSTLGCGDPMPLLKKDGCGIMLPSHYWPNKEVGGTKLKLMFENLKVKAASKPSQPRFRCKYSRIRQARKCLDP